MKICWRRLWREVDGQDLTEYALLLVMVSLAAIAAVGFFGSAIQKIYSNASSTMVSATS